MTTNANGPWVKEKWGTGNWNAYVEAGEVAEDRRTRLLEVPENIRAEVRAHVVTVFELAKSGRDNA